MLQDYSMRGSAQTAVTLLLAGLLLGAAATGRAVAADDEMLDVRIFRNVMEGLGLKRDGRGPVIDYRERSPLVVPPTRNLPPPEDSSFVERNPAWPDDPDARARREASTRQTAPIDLDAESRALMPHELNRPARRGSPSPSPDQAKPVEETQNPLRPGELGFKGFKNWRQMLGFAPRQEESTFKGEPTRTDLTKPPPGYLTPSPSQPYGYSDGREELKAADPMDQAVGAGVQ